jgi:hypothetical protein
MNLDSNDYTLMMRSKHLVLFVYFLVATVATSFAQSLSSDKLLADAQQRIQTLDSRFGQIRDAAQRQLDSANCRSNCPPEVGQRIGDEMMAALDRNTASIHAEVDSFIERAVEGNKGRIDLASLRSALRQILPQSNEASELFEGNSSSGRYVIAAYTINKGVHGNGGTSVMLRAYSVAGPTVKLAGVTGDSMDGYAGVTVQELHPWASSPVAPKSGDTYLLLSGYLTGANGPNNRMRLYAYDGKAFRPIWMPENV